ncbi:MAG: DUF4194 domain-containing protein [Myxococcales bacterium]|nr:DUF4194 domain-containing protein [Myxococcales bacterium]
MNRAAMTLSHVLVALLKGVLDRHHDPVLWQVLLERQADVREHLGMLGLEVVLDDAEGSAYVRQRTPTEDEAPLPRLVARRPLSYPVSLLLALLRKKLVELDAESGERRLIVGRDTLVDMLRVFLPSSANEARFVDRVDAHINKIIELGFLRRLSGQSGQENQFEVQRIVKAYVDAQWLGELEQRLADYRTHAQSLDEEGRST